eukprot:6232831-Pyramimonas_sp.AAC.1
MGPVLRRGLRWCGCYLLGVTFGCYRPSSRSTALRSGLRAPSGRPCSRTPGSTTTCGMKKQGRRKEGVGSGEEYKSREYNIS